MTDVMMTLGPHVFAINTTAYDTFRRQSAWRWPKQDRIDKRPLRQFIGPDSQTITLSGFILPHFNKGGIDALDRLREAGDHGRPLLLVDGRGFVHGDWVVASLEETRSEFMANGQAKRIDFTVTLNDYGSDSDDRKTAFAAPLGLIAESLT